METDKKIHMLAGALIASLTYLFTWELLGWKTVANVSCAVGMSVIAGYVREFINLHYPVAGKTPLFDDRDWLFTIFGGIIGASGMLVINLIWV